MVLQPPVCQDGWRNRGVGKTERVENRTRMGDGLRYGIAKGKGMGMDTVTVQPTLRYTYAILYYFTLLFLFLFLFLQYSIFNILIS